MTQRIFDVENEKDMQDLWDILPIGIIRIKKNKNENTFWSELFYQDIPSGFIKINWHDKTEITRPIQEATEEDIGKSCAFWNKNINDVSYGKLLKIDERFNPRKYQASGEWGFIHCRRLTKQEIEELC
jgi:hypothetical protein